MRPPETHEELVARKAREIREAFITGRCMVNSPDPHLTFDELPAERQQKWLRLARAYVKDFCQ